MIFVMTKRLLTDRNRQLLEEVENLGVILSPTQLERRRQAGFVPCADSRRRGIRVDVEKAARELVALEDYLGTSGDDSLSRAVLPMFFAGCSIRGDILKRDLLESYDALRRFILDKSREYRFVHDKGRPAGRPTRFDVAEGVALALLDAKPAMLRPLLARMNVLSQQDQARRTFDVPAESPESLLASGLAHFFCVFLYGGETTTGWEAIPELLHMVGIDQFVRTVLTVFGVGVDDDMYRTLTLVLPALSLPALRSTVTKATADELHAMRDDLQATLADFSVLGGMLPILVGERGGRLVPRGRKRENQVAQVFLLPAVHNMRRLVAAQEPATALDELQRQVPTVLAAINTLDSPAAQDIDRAKLRKDVRTRASEEVSSSEDSDH